MKRIVLAFVLVGAIGGSAEARPGPHPVAQHGHQAKTHAATAVAKPRQPTFVGFLVKELIWPGLKAGAKVAVTSAVVAAL
jgi:hypothetical protein